MTKILSWAFILTFSFFGASCSKDNDIDVGGNTNIKVINASQGSNDQDFYLANTKINTEGTIAFGTATDYIMATAGDNLTAEFKNGGTENVYASDEVNLKRDVNYSIILAGSGESTHIISTEDNMDKPAEGRVKIRFIHVSDVIQEPIDITTMDGAVLATNIGYDTISNFIEIDPTITTLRIAPTGTSDFREISLGTFAPDQIYSVIIAGSGDIQTKIISHQ